MAKRYRTKKRKTRRRRRRKAPISRGLTVPMRNRARLRYADSLTLDVGVAGVPALYAFRANSIFDPDRSGVGHQPIFHDQYQTFYNHYAVVGSKITVQVVNHNDATQVSQIVGIMLNDDTVTPTTYSELIEQPGGVGNKGGSRWRITTPNTKSSKLSHYFSSKKFFTITDVNDNLDRVGAIMGANPVEEGYFTIFVLPLDSTTDTGAINLLVTIDYLVEFSELKDIAGS